MSLGRQTKAMASARSRALAAPDMLSMRLGGHACACERVHACAHARARVRERTFVHQRPRTHRCSGISQKWPSSIAAHTGLLGLRFGVVGGHADSSSSRSEDT